MWIDSHCHLNHENNAHGDLPSAIIARAKSGGVDGMVNISTEIKGDFESVLKTAKAHENVWCTVGTHPHEAGLEAEKAVTLEELITLAKRDEKIVGIGESGLDYFYDNSPREDQAASFRKHIQACIETDLPLVVHSRDAEEDTLKIICEEGGAKAGLRGVMHCFSSGRILAEGALEEDFYISFSGIVTFKKSTQLQEIAKTIPKDRILVETDAPFLAPMPFRGKINEPAYVAHTGQFLADLLEMDVKDFARLTTENFFRLFNKAHKTNVIP